MSILWLLYALTLMGGVPSTQGSNCSYHALLSHLNLERRSAALAELRPVKNFTQQSFVFVDMFLHAILEVNGKTQTFTCFVTISISWPNDFLQWKPEDFCGSHRLYVRREKIWLPDIIILEDISNTAGSRYNQYALLISSGLVQVVDRYQLTTTCKMELYMFPFDKQECYITFQSVMNREQEVQLWPYFDHSTINDYTREVFISLGEWDFLDINRTVGKYRIGDTVWDQLKYTISLKRRPLLYIINLVIPITFLLILDVASFFISEARGEKLGFKVTILLSISVLLLILQDILPSTADQLPLIALYCIVIFMLTGLSLLETMVVSFLVDMDSCVNKEAVCADGDSVNQKEPVRDIEISPEKTESQPENSDTDVRWLTALQKWLSDTLKTSKKKPTYYGKVAQKIDTAYFCLYLITVIGFMVYMFHEWIQ